MRNSTKEIVNKLLNKSKKENFQSTTSTLKSAFSFKNTNASKLSNKSNTTKSSLKSNLTNHNNSNNNTSIDKRIFQQIFEILKMRLYIESIMNFKDEVIKDIMNENIKLINLKDYDIQTINKFVDDLVDIIKEENKKQKQFRESKISQIENNNNIKEQQSINESINEFSLNSTRRRSININSCGYRPTSVVTQRRRTIEIFMERPKGELKKESMRFNMFDKSLKRNYSFYEGDPYTPGNNRNYDSEGLDEFRSKVIEEVQLKNKN